MRAFSSLRFTMFKAAVICFVLAILCAFLYRRNYEDSDHLQQQNNVLNTESHGNEAGSQVTKIILFTYMRSGSTLLGEIFNQNQDAFYWFEPFAAFHPAYYGMPLVNSYQPLDIYHHWNGSRRYQTQEELLKLRDFSNDLLECNVQQWPAELLVCPLNYIYSQSLNKSFMPCVEKVEKVDTNTGYSYWKEKVNSCKDMIKFCSFFPNTENMFQCASDLENSKEEKAKTKASFSAHKRCMDGIKSTTDSCIPLLQQDCDKTSIRVYKTIRMDMETVQFLLSDNPNIKVIVLVRDPRAMIASREKVSFLALLTHGNNKEEAKYLCQKMMSDLDLLEELQVKHPHTFFFLRYEDLITNPKDTLHNVYKHAGLKVPLNVEKWMYDTFHGQADDGDYGTKRKDPLKGKSKWRTSIDPSAQTVINNVCRNLLERLDYSLT